jgi:hypothetical protein
VDFSTEIGTSSRRDPGRPIAGEFETHLTVRAYRPDAVASLGRWAASHGLVLTPGVLDRGRTPARPTLTLRGTGSLDDQRRAGDRCAEQLAEAGFTVVRTKLEAATWNEGVPRTDAEAAAFPAHCHFVHRVKLRLPIPYDTKRLTRVVEGHTAHLSRNARRVLAGGVQERSVTQRARGVGRPTARARLDALLDSLTESDFRPVDIEEGFVLDDDNPAINGGWVEESAEHSAEPPER